MNVNQKPKIHTLGQQEMEQATAQSGFGDTAISKKAKFLSLVLK